MPLYPTAEDLYISGLLLQHGIMSEEHLDAVRQKALSTPGMTMSDILVEAGYVTFQQRKTMAALLQRTDDVGEMLAGRMPPSALTAAPARKSSTGGRPNDGSGSQDRPVDETFDAPPGIPRDMAATRLYTANEEKEAMADGGEAGADEVSFHGADTQILSPGDRSSTLHPRSEADTGDDEYANERSMAQTIPEQQEMTDEEVRGAQTVFDRDPASYAPTELQHGEKKGAMSRGDATVPELNQTEEDMLGAGEAPEFGVTQPSMPNTPGPSFAKGAPQITGTFGFLADTGVADLLDASAAQHMDLSALLSEAEMSEVRERAATKAAPLLGHKLGGYIVLDKLGSGGMGDVYLAKQLSLNRYVALKALPQHLSGDPRFVERFVHEANMLARINHTNVVRIYDVARAGNLLYITMENVKGESLKEMIDRTSQVPAAAAINIIKQVCRALGRVKKEGIIHRDLKPGNILLDETGEVKVVDFGLADLGTTLAGREGGHTAGTPYYIPPESVKGEPATHLSDQYSLGATFYHMLTGVPPYKGPSLPETLDMHVNAPVPQITDADPTLPPDLERVIAKMMAKEQRGRYRTFREVFEALEAIEMRLGLTNARQEFLDDGLLGLREVSIKNLKGNIAWWSFVAVAFTYAGIGTNLMLKSALDFSSANFLIDVAGNWGTYLVLSAYLIILYVGMIRRRWAPQVWSVRRWIQVHIGMALVGSFLVMVHSGNFLRDYLALTPGDRAMVKPVSLLPLVNSLALMLVVASGMIGRYIYRDLQRQAALESIMENASGDETSERTPPSRMALILISQKVMSYWRIIHYPLTIVFIILTIAHVLSIVYYGGGLSAVPPSEGWFPGTQ